MKGKEMLKRFIEDEEVFILSDGTLNLEHLLPKVYDLIENFELYNEDEKAREIKKGIEEVFEGEPTFVNQYYDDSKLKEDKLEEASFIMNEDVFDYFNDIAPEGYLFGSSEGDGALIGWFKVGEEEED